MERVSFLTDDGAEIVGNYWPAEEKPAVLLLHMMPAAKESWTGFAETLAAAGFGALAIDLRGHGESVRGSGRTLNYKAFSDEEHQASSSDVRRADRWLRENGVGTVMLGGASIGANLALEHLASHPEIPAAFALSPGLVYRGIRAKPLVERLALKQSVLFAAAEDDRNVDRAVEQVEELFEAAACQKEIRILDSGGHGTDMLSRPELAETLVRWLEARVA